MNWPLLIAGVVALFVPCESTDSADAGVIIGIVLIVLAFLLH